jgi:hypothetical protein
LAGVSTLVKKGISAAPREISLQRTLADVQSAKLSAETSLLRARQEISRTDISILQLRNAFANEVTVALRETQAQLDEIASRTDTTANLLQESELAAPRLLALRTRERQARPIYTILRPGVSGTIEINAAETAEVHPGDTLKVEIPLPDISPGELGLTSPFAGSAAKPLAQADPPASERTN